MGLTTRLCLIRHGETAWNAEQRLQGHFDVPLNAVGLRQAAATAACLADQNFAACYSSDLKRAWQTALKASEVLGLAPSASTGLRERHYGLFQGLTYAEARQRFPDTYARFETRDPDFSIPEGGESLQDFSTRVAAALTAIVSQHRGACVLIVTHGGVLDIAHRMATGKSLTAPRDFTIPNAALNWIRHDGRWALEVWGDASHLSAARDELSNT